MASIPPKVSADPSRLQTSLKVGRGDSLSVRYHPYATTYAYSRFDKSARKIVGQLEKLFQAVKKGKLGSVQKSLADKATLNCQNEYGNTILMVAAASPYSHIVEVLLKRGADPTIKNHEGQDALFFAETYKRERTIAMLFSHRIYHTPGATKGKTILMAAAEGGHATSVSLLLETNRFNVNDTDKEGRTALMDAVLNEHTEIVESLLDAGALINQQDNEGRTALMIASGKGHQLIVLQLLAYETFSSMPSQERGVERPLVKVMVDAADKEGWTALMYAALGGHTKIAKALITAKASINQRIASKKTTALMIAAGEGRLPMVCMLLQHKADPHLWDGNGCNAAVYAARGGHEQVLDKLLSVKKLDSWDSYNQTKLLLETAKGGHATLVKKLIDAGIEVGLANEGGMTALMQAAYSGHTETVRELLQLKADVNARDGERQNALMWAAKGDGNQEVAALLLPEGAQLEDRVEDRDRSDFTPLMHAAQSGNNKMVKVLLQKGAKIDAVTREGETAFTLAARWPRVETMKVLAAAGANVNHRNRYGFGALKYAARKAYTEVVQVLLELGADINALDTEGRTALAYVIKEIKETLLDIENDDVEDDEDTSDDELIRKRTPAIRLLVKSGARVDANILEMLDSSLPEITTLLLENESTPKHAQDQSGRTLLVRSIINKQPDEYITLLAKWIDSSLADTDGLTALDHALKMNKPNVVEILARNFARLPAGFESLEKYMEKRNLHLTDQVDAAGKRIPFTSAQIQQLLVAYKSGRIASIKSAEAVLVPTYLGKHSISSETNLGQKKTKTTMRIDGPIMEIIAAYVGGYAFPHAPRT